MEKKEFTRGKILMLMGLLLLMAAAGLYGYNARIDYRAGQQSDAAVSTLVEEIQKNEVTIVEVDDDQSDEARIKVAELDGAYYMGVLSIPSMEKVLPIQSDWSEEKLKNTPCRYSGSIEEGELVIAGHNYKSHFTGLAKLKTGESLVFTDLEGNQSVYEVHEVYMVDATDIEGMVHSGYDLSLFTCNYGGKARVTVRCERLE